MGKSCNMTPFNIGLISTDYKIIFNKSWWIVTIRIMKRTVFYFNRIVKPHQIIQYQINYNNGVATKVKKLIINICLVSNFNQSWIFYKVLVIDRSENFLVEGMFLFWFGVMYNIILVSFFFIYNDVNYMFLELLEKNLCWYVPGIVLRFRDVLMSIFF